MAFPIAYDAVALTQCDPGDRPVGWNACREDELISKVVQEERTMKIVSGAILLSLVLAAGEVIAQGSAGSGTGGTTSGSSSPGASTSTPSQSIPNPQAQPGNPTIGGPNAQANPYQPGTVGQAPGANPANPQDRTTRPNQQDLASPTGRNPQDMRPSGTPQIMREERR
jgi:hypothetical protein